MYCLTTALHAAAMPSRRRTRLSVWPRPIAEQWHLPGLSTLSRAGMHVYKLTGIVVSNGDHTRHSV